MISVFLDAWLRPSSSSQPKTRIMIRYSRRRDTNRDPALTLVIRPNRRSQPLRRVLKRYRAVTPKMWTCRVATSMTNKTYRCLRKIMSTWKKSQASRPSAWVCRNARQEVSPFAGAGLGRRARRIRRTVASLTWCPSRDSSPCTLRYPQAGFSCASLSTRARISWLVPGWPGWFGYVHLRVIRRRCQASSVSGVTSR